MPPGVVGGAPWCVMGRRGARCLSWGARPHVAPHTSRGAVMRQRCAVGHNAAACRHGACFFSTRLPLAPVGTGILSPPPERESLRGAPVRHERAACANAPARITRPARAKRTRRTQGHNACHASRRSRARACRHTRAHTRAHTRRHTRAHTRRHARTRTRTRTRAREHAHTRARRQTDRHADVQCSWPTCRTVLQGCCACDVRRLPLCVCFFCAACSQASAVRRFARVPARAFGHRRA